MSQKGNFFFNGNRADDSADYAAENNRAISLS